MNIFENILAFELQHLPFVFLALLIAFTLHEFAHAYFANLFGDPTAKDQGRVSLNPMVHLDLIGTLLILLVGFGWAKPVPVRRHYFSHPRLMGVIVSAVGPLSNLLIAFFAVVSQSAIFRLGLLDGASVGLVLAIETFFSILIYLNIILFLFNLLPIPPLDGYRIIEDLAPPNIRAKMSLNEQWGLVVFLLIVFIPPLRAITLDKLFALFPSIYRSMVDLVHQFL